jgi:hypothetical protein
MSPQAFALVTLFLACSILVGIVAARLVARGGGPHGRLAYVLPVIGGFGALYLVGHRLGISVGPEVSLFGFQVALPGDLAIGFGAAMLVAAAQAVVLRALPVRRAPGEA